jgi:hypothetical protein
MKVLSKLESGISQVFLGYALFVDVAKVGMGEGVRLLFPQVLMMES